MWSLSVIYTLHKANDGSYELRYYPSSFASIYDNWDMAVDLTMMVLATLYRVSQARDGRYV